MLFWTNDILLKDSIQLLVQHHLIKFFFFFYHNTKIYMHNSKLSCSIRPQSFKNPEIFKHFYLPRRISSKFQSLTRSLVTARLRSRRGAPVMPCPLDITGKGLTFDVPIPFGLVFPPGTGTFRVRQLTTAPHRPSSSELETE